ncbi:hypothetical protein IKG68_02070 [Candidatus Saccharibacteria bacterium]|nr:hypothetical protein [Candidatus Saccharibacteria bacterium]
MSEKLGANETISDNIDNEFLRMAEQIRAEAPMEAKKHFREVRELEYIFAGRNEKLAEAGEPMSEKEFERWEDDLEFELKQGERQVEIGKMNFDEEGAVKSEIVAYHEEKDLAKTVEAQAGNWFYARERALETRLRESGTEDEIRYLHNFYQSVEAHLDFKYMTREEKMDYGDARYERNRTEAHNNAIKHLNGINDLARKYGTRPFTARNFWPSDMRDKASQTPGMAAVMRYDRDIVEEYYAIAFREDVARREAKLRRDMAMGLY